MLHAPSSKSKMYKLLLSDFKEIWMVLAKHIMRKRRVMEKWVDGVHREHELLAELKDCKDPKREVCLVGELEKLQEAEECLAFKDRADQQAYIKACSYNDVWLKLFDDSGNVIALVSSYYCCLGMHNDQTTCLMLTPSKDWETQGVNPLDCKKWYCPSKMHGNKYKASWGQVVVLCRFVKDKWERYYMRAKVPDWDKEDIRAMDMEERVFKEGDSPMDVYNRLEKLVPSCDELIVKAPYGLDDSVMVRSKEDLEQMPWFPWDQIYGIVGYEPADERTKKMARQVH